MNGEFLEDFANRNNIIIGACHAVPLNAERLMASPFVPFVSNDIKKRTDPSYTLKNAESIIVIGVKWQRQEKFNDNTPQKFQLSSLGVNDDYHPIVKKILQDLVEELKKIKDFKYKILVDSPHLDERALAERAGLGFFGCNGLIISEKFGSRFNIGCLVTDIKFSFEQKKAEKSCPPNCTLCIDACPTQALEKNKPLNAEKCISYITQKEEISSEFYGQLYGCDICQNICPFNEEIESVYVNPQEWLTMNDEDFQKKYAHTAMLWRGTKILKRNANIGYFNIQKP